MVEVGIRLLQIWFMFRAWYSPYHEVSPLMEEFEDEQMPVLLRTLLRWRSGLMSLMFLLWLRSTYAEVRSKFIASIYW